MPRRQIPASDLGRSIGDIADDAAHGGHRRKIKGKQRLVLPRYHTAPSWESELVYLHGLNPWDASEHASARDGEGRCPVCEGGYLRRIAYCLGCDRCGRDNEQHRRPYPGLPVGAYLNDDYTPEVQPKYVPDARFRGGLGERVKARKGKVA